MVVSASAGTAGQTLVNYASIDPTGGTSPPTPGPSCAPAASCASSSGNVSGPDLTIAKAAPSPGLVVGAQSTYVLTVTNNGTGAATTAQVQDQLPTGVTFVSASGSGWSCANASGLVTCNFSGSIAASGTSTINVVVSANAGTLGQTLVNYASIDPSGGTSPPTPGPSCAPATSCASSSGSVTGPDLTIAKAAPSPGLVVGAQSTYVLTVTNNGTGTATTAQVQDQLPTGLTFVSAGGTGWVCANASGLVTCDFSGSIAPSGTSTINVVVSASAGTAGQTLVNYASIDPTGGTSPPTPGPSCAPAASCASSSGAVKNSDPRTEGIIHSFLARRGDRIVNNTLELDRLINRLTESCNDVEDRDRPYRRGRVTAIIRRWVRYVRRPARGRQHSFA